LNYDEMTPVPVVSVHYKPVLG